LIAGVRSFESVVAEVEPRSQETREHWRSEELNCQGSFYPYAAPCPGIVDDVVIAASGHLIPPRLLHIGHGESRTLMDFGHDGLDAIIHELRPVTPYRWQAPDGQEIHGWLMRGPAKAPAPLVMEVHGGPIWRWSPIFLGRSAYHAMLAERGYALFWPNPRGSSGRGQAFAAAVVGDMGGADTRDYLSGLDKLVADGVADPRRIGVMGGSYGGFMTSWLITQDPRFAAAIPVAPVTNWVSQHLTSNIPYFDTFCLGSRFTDLTGKHYSRSPVQFAHRVRTPTLNVCGALDRCTPPGQAREFHAALRENGVESVLVTYPQEGHGVRTFPGLIDYAARVVDWFERHLN
jgi:dipeptidyl aminopeptidase/acylaminoacyl peptidase